MTAVGMRLKIRIVSLFWKNRLRNEQFWHSAHNGNLGTGTPDYADRNVAAKAVKRAVADFEREHGPVCKTTIGDFGSIAILKA